MPPRIFLDAGWSEGETLVLPPAASRHVQVLRLQPGEPLVLFNGRDGAEWPAQVLRMGRSEVELRIAGAAMPVPRELACAVTLAIGMPANERMDGLVEKATELGAAAIVPLVAARSVVRLSGERAEARQRHWQGVATAAAEQCGRARVPAVALPGKLDAWLASLPAAGGERWLLSFAAEARLPAAMFQNGDRAPALTVLSGPEGGLSPEEETAALRCGFRPVSLGPRTLRADTAPLALLSWLGLIAPD